jgi:hypothetical protein
LHQRAYAEALAPRHLLLAHGQANIREAHEDAFEGDRSPCSGELKTEAEMRTRAEGKGVIGLARDVELVRVLEFDRVGIRRRQKRREDIAAPSPLSPWPSRVAGRSAPRLTSPNS